MRVRQALTVPDLETTETRKLAKKNLWVTGLLTFPLPFVGYLYTARYPLASITCAIWLICSAAVDEDFAGPIVGFLMIGSTIENMVAVLRARSERGETGLQLQQYPQVRDVRIELLKLAKSQGEVTLADCVIATELPADEVRLLLSEFEYQDLMRSSNRESDGAIVYRVV
ncbi:hypothetical protein [Pseudanabaena sp. FACHB-2040]|uniref:hypothetical protein n=1 Tax=Pseudanabaena sp. FACHB-2040 TaxID=2692859 RepID=UPI0016822E55|nr:hypothetical protein [Pseudanabaena sp. FACHB-2040]MBD2259646.1 hypothetical protein [Pseudanabaena sp. FACHB-2040]